MLGKLLKYDIKAELKSDLPMYLITLGLCAAIRIMSIVVGSFPILSTIYGFMIGLGVVALIGVIIWTMIVSVKHFYTNVLKDEGYLTNTLPVTRNQIILSKEITGTIMMVFAGVVLFAGLMLAFFHGSVEDIYKALAQAVEVQGVDSISFIIWVFVMMGVSYLSQLVLMFTAMMLGQTRNTNKVMYSVVFGIILSTLMQIVSFIALGIDLLIAPDLMAVMDSATPEIGKVYDYLVLVFTTTLVLSIITTILLHMGSVWLANRKLNLE